MAKDPSRITAGEMQKKVAFMGSENLFRNVSNSTNITTCFLEGLQEKKEKKMVSPKNYLQHIQLSDTTERSNGTGFYGQM